MPSNDQFLYCQQCELRDFSPQEGIICSKTNKKADFKIECPDFVRDENVVFKIERGKEYSPDRETKVRTGFIWGGVIIMGVALFLMNFRREFNLSEDFSDYLFLLGAIIAIFSSRRFVSILGAILFVCGFVVLVASLLFRPQSEETLLSLAACCLGIGAIILDRYIKKYFYRQKQQRRTQDLLDLD